MKKLAGMIIVVLLVGSLASLTWANKACQTPDGAFNIMISPNTLILSSLCDVITVHSNIPYGAVVETSVAVNGVEVPFTKADACGDLVAKIGVDDLAEFQSFITEDLSADPARGHPDDQYKKPDSTIPFFHDISSRS